MSIRLTILIGLSFFLLALPLTKASAATTIAGVEQELVGDVKRAQQRLSRLQAAQLKERQSLAKRLAGAEQEVAQLRQTVAVSQRLADEKTLALDDLKKRLKTWQDQNQYQRFALANYFSTDGSGDQPLPALLSQFEQQFNQVSQALAPQWQSQKVVNAQGVIELMNVLRVGPVAWGYAQQSQTGGLLNQAQLPEITYSAPRDWISQWQQAAEQGQGQLHFDPTLGRALELAQQKESLLQHITKGGVWVVPILLFGLVACICAVMKLVQLWRLPKWLPAVGARARQACLREDNTALTELIQQCQGSQRELLTIAAQENNSGQRENELFNFLMRNNRMLERGLGTIAIIAAVAPLLGLLGTVSGMIKTFKLMTIFGAGDASAVSGGISEALVTTELGLVVAIPALLLHASLQRKVKSHVAQHEELAIELNDVPFTGLKHG